MRTLDQWLVYQQSVHPRSVELGLQRVREVAQRLQIGRIAPRVVIVAGTNGKGSSVAILAAIQRAAGRRVGCYTSPHLLEYRERIQLPEGLVSEAALLEAFERIEAARQEISLSFFEYGTLAALLCMAQARLDVAILEVGLGGRLDAVNLVDADAALITTIGLDHQEWLGRDLDAIGAEKAGVLRQGQHAVYADQPPVRSVLVAAQRSGCALLRPGQGYRYWRSGPRWSFQDAGQSLELPWPVALQAPVQIHNLAACVALTLAMEPAFPHAALQQGVAQARVAGRLQLLQADPPVWLDIGHNPQAAAALRDWLLTQPHQPTLAVFGALSDKDVGGVLEQLRAVIDHWWLVPLDALSPRGLSLHDLRERLPQALSCSGCADLDTALQGALAQASACAGRVLVLGSFVLAEQVLRWPGWPLSPASVSFTVERQ